MTEQMDLQDPQEPRLEQRLDRLEAIVSALAAEDIELEEALALFEEGIAHLREAQRLVGAAELKIARLLDDGAGGTVLDPMRQGGA